MGERAKLMLPLLCACLIYAPSVAKLATGSGRARRLALLYIIAAFLGYGLSDGTAAHRLALRRGSRGRYSLSSLPAPRSGSG